MRFAPGDWVNCKGCETQTSTLLRATGSAEGPGPEEDAENRGARWKKESVAGTFKRFSLERAQNTTAEQCAIQQVCPASGPAQFKIVKGTVKHRNFIVSDEPRETWQ